MPNAESCNFPVRQAKRIHSNRLFKRNQFTLLNRQANYIAFTYPNILNKHNLRNSIPIKILLTFTNVLYNRNAHEKTPSPAAVY